MIGRTISHYRILSNIGHGGMGVVYEAEDMRLGRHVALKVLPEDLANDAVAFERLKREARAACRLNHPNICTIHEIEEENGQPVIVMELLDGQTLKDRLGQGAIPLPEMLDLGIQIADALHAAHELGIVHRDIKPANIFLTKHGSIKVLDFGLAKLLARVQPGSAEPTVPDAMDQSLTAIGVIPGTASYMSPEQAVGEPLDTRTDLFSLGTVLYEMATGEQPFRRKNRMLTLNAILSSHPRNPSRIKAGLPAELDTIITKALAKDRADRHQTAAELRDALWHLKSSLGSAEGAPFSHAELASGRASAVNGAVPQHGSSAAAPPSMAGPRVLRRWGLILSSTLVIIAVGVTAFLYSHRSVALTEKDTIVLADFENKTGDPVFDETLKQALAVDLAQSPFLNILSDRKVSATLRLMGRSPDQALTGEVARELCQRVGSKAMLAGSISNLGNEYIIGLNAINCTNGDTLVAEQARASGKDEVLKSLDNSASAVRGKLGESLASVQKFSTAIEEATTSSLDALKAYSLGRRAGFAKGDVAGLAYFQRAVELDPNFALAYRSVAVGYSNLGQTTRAAENETKAFELRQRVSEREKYPIEAQYYSLVTGELDKSNQVFEQWKQSYPRDPVPSLNQGDIDMRLGRWEKGVQETQESLRLEPNSSMSHSNLAWMQLALGNTEEARRTLEQASARNLESQLLRLALYQTAFLQGDRDTMQQQLAWAAGRPAEEDWLLSAQADTEAYFGRLAKAREFSERAIESASHADAKEAAALWQVDAALREAEFGNASSARQDALAALALFAGRDVRCFAALALARAGDTAHAQKLAGGLNKDFPLHTLIQGYWLPSIRAAIEINAKNSAKALQLLESATPYELSQSQPFQFGMLYPIYLRGQAHLVARQGEAAAVEFQNIIDHRGIVLNFPLGALADVGLARAYALQGNTAKAQAAYGEFLKRWNTADTDIPILQQVKSESAKLR